MAVNLKSLTPSELKEEYLKRFGTQVNPKLPVRLYEQSVLNFKRKFWAEYSS